MIQPLQIGDKLYRSNLIQAPLAGVSNAAFRKLIWRYSQPAYTCTEMISCKTLIHQSDAFLNRFIHKDKEEGPLCVQLSGRDPQELALATIKATAKGADLIDLNCGCPVKKIRQRKAGSALLSQASLLFKLMITMKQHTHLPVSIKIRVDGASGDQFNRDMVQAINDAGIDLLIVHGRHWTEKYNVNCRYDEIRFFVEHANMPVIGNGDVSSASSLQAMWATGVAGAMIGRAGVGQPWLIQTLMDNTCLPPSLMEIGQLFVEHTRDLAELLQGEKFAVLESRKLAKYYARNVPNKDEFCAKINLCENLQQVMDVSLTYFTEE